MQVGIFAKTFAGTEPAAVLEAVRAAGYGCTQFNMACAGLPSMPDAIPPEVAESIRHAATSTGVTLSALSGTYNMIHPDPRVRAAGMDRLGTLLQAAEALGIGLVTLCTGTRDAQDQWRHHPDNASAAAWDDLLREMTAALMLAEAAGVDLGVEPEQANVVASAADARRLIDALGSPRLRIVLDPANLFEVADRAQARLMIADAVETLAGRIALAHAKDRHPDGSFATAGTGVIDFADFTARLRQVGFDGPMVAHGLSAQEAPAVAAFLSGIIDP